MPQYFFHVSDGKTAIDQEGVEYPNLAAARGEAIEGLRQLVSNEALSGAISKSRSIIISDEAGVHLDVISFGDAVMVKDGQEGQRPVNDT